MKRIVYVSLLVILLAAVSLAACSSQSSTSTTTEPLVFPEHGNIKIASYGYFNFQRYDRISEETEFKGVIFAPHQEQPGVTSTGPIAYKIDVKFEDGTVETLQNIGLGSENNIDINLTQHENPRAGIILAWHDGEGGLIRVLYLLVGE